MPLNSGRIKMSSGESEAVEGLPAVRLPTEILVQIFGLLPWSDVLECGLVCRDWADATQAAHLHRNTTVTFDGDEQLARGLPAVTGDLVLEGFRPPSYSRLSVSRASLDGSVLTRWAPLLPRLSSLHLRQCTVTEKDLASILSQCCGLRRLGLENMKEVFISGQFLSSKSASEPVCQALCRVEELDLSHNQYLTDALFLTLAGCTENLSSLVLDGCRIMNHSGIYKKFYPGNGDDDDAPSKSVFTFRSVLKLLRERTPKIVKLSLFNSSVDGFAVQDMAKVENLQLTHLNLGMCSSVSQEAMVDIARSNGKSLRLLNIDRCRRVLMDYPATSLSLFQDLTDLRSLSLRTLTVPSILEDCLVQTDKLEELDCSELDCPGRHLCEGLASSGSQTSLRTLRLRGFGCSPDIIAGLASILANVTLLDLTNCQEGVTDAALQAVIDSMRHLEDLRLDLCRRLTDAGFSGLPALLEPESKDRLKIFLGSRAEAKIKSSARAKERLRQLERDGEQQERQRIDSLRQLRFLDMGRLIEVTDLTLESSFAFEDLRVLNISGCEYLSDAGLAALANKNKRLEVLRANGCRRLGRDGFQALVENCPRLRELYLEGCPCLPPEFLTLLPSHCPGLTILDVSFCSKLKPAHVKALRSCMPQLRKIDSRGLHINECLEDLGESLGTSIPSPPPPPPKVKK